MENETVSKMSYSLASIRKNSVPMSRKNFIFRAVMFKPSSKRRFSKEISTIDMVIT